MHMHDPSNFSARKLIQLLLMFGLMIHLCASFHGVVRRADGGDSDSADDYADDLWWSMTAITALGTIGTPRVGRRRGSGEREGRTKAREGARVG